MEQAIDQIVPRDAAHAQKIESMRLKIQETQARQAELIKQFSDPGGDEAQMHLERKRKRVERAAEQAAHQKEVEDQQAAQLAALERIVHATRKANN